jgi:dihydropyrimidinase
VQGRAGGGPDADIVLLQAGTEKTIRAADLHETDYTPWEGHVVTAWPTTTILRGNVVVEEGAFHGDLKHGQFLKRKVADEIPSGPAI